MNVLGKAAVAAAAVVALGAAAPATASASVQWDLDTWGPICLWETCGGNASGAEGAVSWSNRTAEVSGHVWDNTSGHETVVAYFTAYAGSTAIEGQTRSAANQDRSFRFPIGDPDLVGGVNRVKIQVCVLDGTVQLWCSTPVQVWRD